VHIHIIPALVALNMTQFLLWSGKVWSQHMEIKELEATVEWCRYRDAQACGLSIVPPKGANDEHKSSHCD